MEKVKVVKAIPGMLNVGDILISHSLLGADFELEEKDGNNERYVSLDYTTVSENMPKFFQPVEITDDDELVQWKGCDCCDCHDAVRVGDEKTADEIQTRYVFFQEQFDNAAPGSEKEIVYKNLMWFIEWMYGYKELV